MPRKRIFISHSARDGRAADVRKAIKDALENDPQYAILMDDISLEPGDAWRARINLWIGSCDAAVVVVSPGALVKPWVLYELSILGHRRWRDPDFRIIPVFVDVTFAQVRNSLLEPTQAAEWQSVIEGEPEDVAAKVVQGLDGVVAKDSRPIERMAKVLDARLPADDTYYQDAAAELGIELQWDAGHSPRFCLALQILGSGMTAQCARALRALREDAKFKDNVDKVIELVTSAWVDLNAEKIPPLIKKKPRPPALVLNAGFADTVKMYLGGARYTILPTLRYMLAEPNTVIEERPDEDAHAAEVVEAVRHELYTAIGVSTDESLKESLREYSMDLGEPVIVVIPVAAVNLKIVAELQSAFEHVTFFLLVGGKSVAGIQSAALHVICPPLGEGDEAKCREQAVTFRGLVNKK